jgi:phenylpropionate dioxygenase-like ring-hydroxylating dioxygenase large terminal subunit
LVDAADNAPEITCSFHGWSWNLDGSLKSVPCRWDFPALSDDEAGLLEVRAESWNGLAFINFDPDAAPLIDFLESLPSHFEQWPGNQLWKAVHVGKVVPCNWKLALEAFLEGYHVVRTHPQLLLYAGDCNGRYDFWGPHARMLASMGVPSPHVGPADEQDVVDAMVRDGFVNTLGEKGGEVQIPQVGPGQTSRSVLADFMKAALTQQTGVDYSEVSDTDVLDTIQYFVFPNVVIFAGYAFPVMYRFRPNGSENSCLWEIMVNVKLPEGMERPPDVPMRMTDPDASWSEVAELQAFGPGLDQDMVNLALFQRGVQQDGYEGPLFSNYQERNLRNFRRHLEGWISQ